MAVQYTAAAAVIIGILQLTASKLSFIYIAIYNTSNSVSIAQPQRLVLVSVQFADIDFQEIEGEDGIDVTLTVTVNTPIDLKLIVTPYTFKEYQIKFGVEPFLERSEGVDKAECELKVVLSSVVFMSVEH